MNLFIYEHFHINKGSGENHISFYHFIQKINLVINGK